MSAEYSGAETPRTLRRGRAIPGSHFSSESRVTVFLPTQLRILVPDLVPNRLRLQEERGHQGQAQKELPARLLDRDILRNLRLL